MRAALRDQALALSLVRARRDLALKAPPSGQSLEFFDVAREQDAPNPAFLPVLLVLLGHCVHNALADALLHVLAMARELFGDEMAILHLTVLADKTRLTGVVGAVEIAAIAGRPPDGLAVFSGECEGAAVGGFTGRHHDHASDDEDLLQVGEPGRRRFTRGMRECGRAQLQTASLIVGRRLGAPPCLVDQSQAAFDEDRLSVAAFGLTAHGKHFLALFPETLGGPFRDILQHIGLSLVDRGVPARIDDRIPFIDLRAKDLCARVKRGNRNRNKATGEPVIGGAADEAVETSSFCNGSDVLGLGVEVFDGNAENMGNLMRTREARIKRNVGLKAFELDAMSQLLRRVSRPGGAACQKKRNRYGDRKDKSFCGLFVISVGCGGPAES